MVELSTLEKYMITKEMLSDTREITNNIKANKKCFDDNIDVNAIGQNQLFFPDEKDTLFWCFYITLHGIDNFHLNKSSLYEIEKKFKFACAETLRSIANQLKKHKLKRIEIENNLINEPCINVQTLMSLCIIHRISFTYVCKHVYYEFLQDNTQRGVFMKEKNKVGLLLSDEQKNDESIKENRFFIDNPQKPLKGISSYSARELKDICVKMKLPIGNKKTMYQSISEKIE